MTYSLGRPILRQRSPLLSLDWSVKVVGIKLSADSARSVTPCNASLNECQDKCSFLSGDAANVLPVLKNPEELPRHRTAQAIGPLEEKTPFDG